MTWTRAGIALGAVAVATLALSGARADDPQTPPGLPGLPPPFFGTAVIGSGGRAAAVDAYGDIVDLRAPGPAGHASVAVSAARQAAGTVPSSAALVAHTRLGDGSLPPLWRADAVRQRYLPGTNVLRTTAWFEGRRTAIVRQVGGPGAIGADRRWLAHARSLGPRAPRWARRMYRRSLLVLRALTDRRSGAVAAGARDGWAYVWPRDAATVAIAFANAGYRPQARRIVRFLEGLELGAAARFDGSGAPVPGRAAQGDAAGWVAAAARVVDPAANERKKGWRGQWYPWRGRADYQEGDAGDYLGNAIASTATESRPAAPRGSRAGERDGWLARAFGGHYGLVRAAGDAGSGLDSAAAWAVRPFPQPSLYPLVRRTLLGLVADSGPFGIVPSEGWSGGEDPWTAPTAWTAWALAALAAHDRRAAGHRSSLSHRERGAALRLVTALRRDATPLGLLPERVGARSGRPTSTTPLAWSHAFAILALRELWPGRDQGRAGQS